VAAAESNVRYCEVRLNVDGQKTAGVMAGFQFLSAWTEHVRRGYRRLELLAFIVNQNTEADGRFYAYFVEQERNEDAFIVADVANGGPSNLINAEIKISHRSGC